MLIATIGSKTGMRRDEKAKEEEAMADAGKESIKKSV